MTKRVLLVDGNNYAYRGYYALMGENLSSKDGMPTEAIRGFFTILSTDLKVLRPTHLAVSFDRTPSYRRLEIYPEYKAGRDKQHKVNVKPQIQVIRRILRAMGISVLGIVGEESDDIIGTLATKFSVLDYQVLISSTDKDFAQLVSHNVGIVEARSRNIIDGQGVLDKYGVKPHQMLEYLMMMGDDIDNIPGVAKVGKKTAAKLLAEYKTLKQILKAASAGKLTPALRSNLLDFEKRGLVKLNRALIALDTNVNIRFAPKRFALRNRTIDHDRVEAICSELGMRSTHKLLQEM